MSTAKYTPNAVDLNGAIKSQLDKGTTDGKVIHQALVQEHPNWKLPERRVAKFVKRQQAGAPVGADDDSVTPSVRSVGSIRSWMKKRRSNRSARSNTQSATRTQPPPAQTSKRAAHKPPEAPLTSTTTTTTTTTSSKPPVVPDAPDAALPPPIQREALLPEETRATTGEAEDILLPQERSSSSRGSTSVDQGALCEGCWIL